jgi:peroxin-13
MGGGYGGYGGGMGGGYGGMNGGMGMGGMGGGMIGPDGQPMEASIGQRMESAFQVLYSISAFFSSFSQLIDSSFSATHSSFFAMIGVAEQLGMFRHYLGSALNIFEMVRWIRELGNRIIGREPQAGQITAEGFRAFESGSTGSPSSSGQPKKSSRKPLLIFLLTVVGLPWLLTRIASAIANRRLHAAAAPGGAPLPSSAQHPGGPTPLDPSSLLFTRALHPYTAPPGETGELTFVANDIIAILSTEEERSTSSWWLGRTRDGRIGWLPSTYVELLSESKVALSASKQKIKDEEEQARKKTPE